MRLYTVQPLKVYDSLVEGHPYEARPREAPDSPLNDVRNNGWLKAYDWLRVQRATKGIAPAQDPAVYPVWAWCQWGGPRRRKPDLRTQSLRRWAAKDRHVLLTLEVPDALVQLSDCDAWHWCLNYWFLGRPREVQRFEKAYAALNLSYYKQKPLPDRGLGARLRASWQGIFDLSRARCLLETRKRDQIVQAAFWRIEPGQVTAAVEFGRGTKATTRYDLEPKG